MVVERAAGPLAVAGGTQHWDVKRQDGVLRTHHAADELAPTRRARVWPTVHQEAGASRFGFLPALQTALNGGTARGMGKLAQTLGIQGAPNQDEFAACPEFGHRPEDSGALGR